MAKLKRYELYGDGETIPGEYTGPKKSDETSLPGKMPYGRAEETRKRPERRKDSGRNGSTPPG